MYSYKRIKTGWASRVGAAFDVVCEPALCGTHRAETTLLVKLYREQNRMRLERDPEKVKTSRQDPGSCCAALCSAVLCVDWRVLLFRRLFIRHLGTQVSQCRYVRLHEMKRKTAANDLAPHTNNTQRRLALAK